MSHDLHIDSGVSKDEIYAQLLPQLTALTEGESDMIARMANLCAALHQTFGWLWTGFYRAKGDELVLGPFQGPLACVRIKRGKGVCGTAWIKEETIVVPDVEKFPGHIACSSLSRSEIVVPIKNSSGETIAVLDIDSEQTDTIDDTYAHWLGNDADLLSKCR